jgi:putative addiction module component (TIGR02574 family)
VGAERPPINIEELTVAERIQLVEDLWDSVEPESSEIGLTSAEAAELDRRVEHLRRWPDSGEPWEVVRDRLYDRLRRGD